MVTDVERNLAKWVEAGHCTAGVPIFSTVKRSSLAAVVCSIPVLGCGPENINLSLFSYNGLSISRLASRFGSLSNSQAMESVPDWQRATLLTPT